MAEKTKMDENMARHEEAFNKMVTAEQSKEEEMARMLTEVRAIPLKSRGRWT